MQANNDQMLILFLIANVIGAYMMISFVYLQLGRHSISPWMVFL